MEKIVELVIKNTSLVLVRSQYQDSGRDAYELIEENGTPYATVTVNIPEVPLEEGFVLAKTWSGNEEIASLLLKAGIFEDTGRRVPCGFTQASVWRFAGV